MRRPDRSQSRVGVPRRAGRAVPQKPRGTIIGALEPFRSPERSIRKGVISRVKRNPGAVGGSFGLRHRHVCLPLPHARRSPRGAGGVALRIQPRPG
jgi:hypothetical protein